jgi:hypothetical protein
VFLLTTGNASREQYVVPGCSLWSMKHPRTGLLEDAVMTQLTNPLEPAEQVPWAPPRWKCYTPRNRCRTAWSLQRRSLATMETSTPQMLSPTDLAQMASMTRMRLGRCRPPKLSLAASSTYRYADLDRFRHSLSDRKVSMDDDSLDQFAAGFTSSVRCLARHQDVMGRHQNVTSLFRDNHCQQTPTE